MNLLTMTQAKSSVTKLIEEAHRDAGQPIPDDKVVSITTGYVDIELSTVMFDYMILNRPEDEDETEA